MPIETSGTKPPLYCVHGHLGEVFYGHNLSHVLGPEQPLFGFRSQGLGGESPFQTVPEMAMCYLKELRASQPAGPYFLAGWCFGGMIAYEMARLLQEEESRSRSYYSLIHRLRAPYAGGHLLQVTLKEESFTSWENLATSPQNKSGRCSEKRLSVWLDLRPARSRPLSVDTSPEALLPAK